MNSYDNINIIYFFMLAIICNYWIIYIQYVKFMGNMKYFGWISLNLNLIFQLDR